MDYRESVERVGRMLNAEALEGEYQIRNADNIVNNIDGALKDLKDISDKDLQKLIQNKKIERISSDYIQNRDEIQRMRKEISELKTEPKDYRFFQAYATMGLLLGIVSMFAWGCWVIL